MISKRKILIFLFCAFSNVSGQNAELSSDEHRLLAKEIQEHTQYLSSDLLEGRGTGLRGDYLAADYIAQEFKRNGLIPLGSDHSYYQKIPMHGSFPLISSDLRLYIGDEEVNLQLEDEYLLFNSGQQTFIPLPVSLVFVGYGIIAPEFDYNDYQEVDVEKKIVVFLDGEPESDNPDFFNGNHPTIYSYANSKQRIAISRGASGSILIPDLKDSDWNKKVGIFSFEDVNLAYAASNNLSIMINPLIAGLLFKNAEFSFGSVMQMKENKKLKSFPLNIVLTFRGEYRQRDFLSQNVAGLIQGIDSEMKDSYLIISAHFDHLGIGPESKGDSIYNGTLDNAIGTSVLLSLSRKFAQLTNPPKRSVIFLSLTGEEKGLLGSKFYIDNPLVPLFKTVANINIDGIAFFRDFESVVGVGSEYSTLGKYLNETASKLSLKIDSIPSEFNQIEAFSRSDQVSFALAGIPSILVMEGLKNKNKSRDEVLNSFVDYILHRYHTPFDDIHQDIDFTAAAQHTEFLFDLALSIANSEQVPEWKSGTSFINARLRSIAEKK